MAEKCMVLANVGGGKKQIWHEHIKRRWFDKGMVFLTKE